MEGQSRPYTAIVVTERFGRTVWISDQSVTRCLPRTEQQTADIPFRNLDDITCLSRRGIPANIYLCYYSPSLSRASSFFAVYLTFRLTNLSCA